LTVHRKSSARLDREIRESLARSSSRVHSTQVAGWWRKAAPEKDHVCYDTKTKALKAFLDTNYDIVQHYGGADYEVSPSEFDVVNHKYSLHGSRVARTIAQAVWAAMPEGRPFCLDRIDVDVLNDTSPARETGSLFRLPDYVYASEYERGLERHYREQEAHARICHRCRRPLI
jgi:hypothetical protein